MTKRILALGVLVPLFGCFDSQQTSPVSGAASDSVASIIELREFAEMVDERLPAGRSSTCPAPLNIAVWAAEACNALNGYPPNNSSPFLDKVTVDSSCDVRVAYSFGGSPEDHVWTVETWDGTPAFPGSGSYAINDPDCSTESCTVRIDLGLPNNCYTCTDLVADAQNLIRAIGGLNGWSILHCESAPEPNGEGVWEIWYEDPNGDVFYFREFRFNIL